MIDFNQSMIILFLEVKGSRLWYVQIYTYIFFRFSVLLNTINF